MRKQIEEEREKLHIKLQEAFDKIKTLKGLLPRKLWERVAETLGANSSMERWTGRED